MNGENNVNTMTSTDNSGGSSLGPIIGVLVVLAVIALVGFYFWNRRTAEAPVLPTEEAVKTIETQGASDETSTIEADLEATDVEAIDLDTVIP